MCTSCLSSAEAAVIHGAVGLALARGAVERVGDALAGRSRAERRAMNWDANAAFVVGLGLDPEAVLGARPVVPAPDPAPVAVPVVPVIPVSAGLGLRGAAV